MLFKSGAIFFVGKSIKPAETSVTIYNLTDSVNTTSGILCNCIWQTQRKENG